MDCNYYLPNEFKKQLPIDKQKSQSFSMLHLNIRSISNKFDCFKQFLDALDIHFQIIGLTETWLNDINHDSFNLNGYKYIGTNRSKKRGGGVGMYISKQLSFKNS
jgi:exonuclease III